MPVISPSRKTKNNLEGILRTVAAVKADANGDLPSRIMIMQAGEWPDSVKGNLTITSADLYAIKRNFDSGIARAGQGLGLPIDFSHNEWAEAGAWINGLEVEGDALFADPVDWTDLGKQQVGGGMFKCISPSFYPAGRGGWQDPENLETNIENVLVGAGFTNIPFFRGLSPVKASTSSEEGEADKNIIFISASKETSMPTLDQVRVKAAADLTEEDKKILADNKAELSGEELKKFGLEASAPAPTETNDQPEVTEEDRNLLASIKSGEVKTVKATEAVVDAARVESLEATAKKYLTEKAEAVVDTHIARGAIKADARERWTNRLLDASETERAQLEADMTAMVSNPDLAAGELGANSNVEADADPSKQLAKLAQVKIDAAKAEGKELTVTDAQKQVLAENKELADQYSAANKIV